jgi:hypothetical protein
MRTTDDVVHQLRAEFLEMPGLRLRPEQVQRLCGIERTLCQTLLDVLVAARFLCVSADGTYARASGTYARASDSAAPSRPAKAYLRRTAQAVKTAS